MPTGRSSTRRTSNRNGRAGGESVEPAPADPSHQPEAGAVAEPISDAVAGAPADAGSASAGDAGTEPVAEADQPVALNRAERRAHSRGKSLAPHTGKGKVAGQKGPVQGPRMWANRRSG